MTNSRKIRFFLAGSIWLLCCRFCLSGEITATIGAIEIRHDTLNGQAGYRFTIKDVQVNGARGTTIHFGFNIYQGKWLKDGWKSQPAMVVPYAETNWADGGWFFYDYAYLNTAGNKSRNFEGHFFIVDTATTGEIASKSIEFTTKTMFDYFAEGYKRLKKHPQAEGFYLDDRVAGEWARLQLHPEGYGVTVSYINFKPGGTGSMESAPWYLKQDGSLRTNEAELKQYPLYWGVVTDFTAQNEPVTLLKMVFQDQSYAFYYYACFEDDSLGVIYFDEQAGRAGQDTNIFLPYDRFAADWNRNADKLAAALVKAYQSDLEVQAIRNSTLSMTLMGEHWAFTNLLNSMAW